MPVATFQGGGTGGSARPQAPGRLATSAALPNAATPGPGGARIGVTGPGEIMVRPGTAAPVGGGLRIAASSSAGVAAGLAGAGRGADGTSAGSSQPTPRSGVSAPRPGAAVDVATPPSRPALPATPAPTPPPPATPVPAPTPAAAPPKVVAPAVPAPRPTPPPPPAAKPEPKPEPKSDLPAEPRLVSRATPSFPPADAAGSVTIAIAVNAGGTVTSVDVTNSSGSSAIDSAARAAGRRFRFSPAQQGKTFYQTFRYSPQ